MVFISWSGEQSREIANVIDQYLNFILQPVTTFYSPDDVRKGDGWDDSIHKALKEASFCIVCLTPTNLESPWLHYEAGIVSTKGQVSALLSGVKPSAIKGALSRFQASEITYDDMYNLIFSINLTFSKPLSPEAVRHAFDLHWEAFRSKIKAAQERHAAAIPEKKNVDFSEIRELKHLVERLTEEKYVQSDFAALCHVINNAKIALSLLADAKNNPSMINDASFLMKNSIDYFYHYRDPKVDPQYQQIQFGEAMVAIRNPWGYRAKPKGPKNLEQELKVILKTFQAMEGKANEIWKEHYSKDA